MIQHEVIKHRVSDVQKRRIAELWADHTAKQIARLMRIKCTAIRNAIGVMQRQGVLPLKNPNYRARVRPSAIRIRAMILEEIAASGLAVTVGDVMSHDQRAALVWIRARVAKRLYATELYSLPGIGDALGGRDHSTIVNLVKRTDRETAPKLSSRKPTPVENCAPVENMPNPAPRASKPPALPPYLEPSLARMMGAR